MKLYIIVRNDLTPGLQAAQACHAALAWAAEHGSPPENLVVLHATSEAHVRELHARAVEAKTRAALFCEPDLKDAATALAVGPEARRMTSTLPLALRASA